MEQRINVAIRIRPPLQKERFDPLCAHKADDGRTVIIKDEESMGAPSTFQFDEVFDGGDDQCQLYTQSVQELVDDALQGANVTVLTYGQTGSGKTYTILGSLSSGDLTEESGIFPRVFHDIFAYREAVKRERHLLVFISAVEIYVDDVMDLLSKRKRVKLRETPEGTLTPGVNIIELRTVEDVIQTFNMANSYRSVTSTKINDCSSRSHALFFIDIFQMPLSASSEPPAREQLIDASGIPISGDIKGLVRSRIALVDLAGSERVKRTGVEGQAMVEAQAINKSLAALGTTINAMYMESNHIPFRESKLTRLLKPLFVDRNSRLLLIGQISPPSVSAQESRGTLRFCDRVKGLKAGSPAFFLSQEDEESYIRSLRQQEELTAELRIAGAECYYQPMRPLFMAYVKNISVDEARRASIDLLQRDASSIVARKEEECMRAMEAEIRAKQMERVHAFADKMNQMIDEYEALSHAVKKEKKDAKRRKEEQAEEQEKKLIGAKKAKKTRLKMEAKVEKLNIALKEMERHAEEMEAAFTSPLVEDTNESTEELTTGETPKDDSVQLLVENFHSHTTELNRLQDLYAQWLGATQRQRSQVRRAKLFSSSIIMDGTLVYDIIDFIIDRSVDIADGVSHAEKKFSWNDIDGFSSLLRSGERLYPPLVTTPSSKAEVCEPSAYHNVTFLSSDESDEENSHHREENRMLRGDSRSFSSSEGPNTPIKGQYDALGDKRAQGTFKQPEWNGLQQTANLEGEFILQGRDGSMADANGDDTDDNCYDEEKKGEGEERAGKQPRQNKEENTNDEEAQSLESTRKRDVRDNEYLMRVYDSPTLVHDLIRFLRGGTVMLKHGRSGRPHFRYFWVTISQNSRKLVWTEPESKITAERSSIDLDDVSFIQLGCFSKVFKRHPVASTDPSFYRSFTLGLKGGGRTVDIVAGSLPDFEAWIVGLSNLVRVDPVWGGKLDITKEAHFEQLNCFEASLCEMNYIYPSQYILLKKRVKRIAMRTLGVLEQCGNDATKAYKILGGIHPPAVNEKGAVYLTKGELRFIGLNDMDILRITKVWILFQQMNLVYDENFVPATTFGVTERH
ncbi:putative kinesin [Trypanosoma cruzi]|uniref:Kinesin, putative n=2 Tax=Trypanosoma cruzi TaxID=5693 RepID=Q4DB48_TRYCC|nr:kinesin, putative [Trypanosoma cruzi]EAN89748.1 kinesin, putative [Trypanosoma cruzi]PWV15755.1 putative kinesin [Trypanosoma cruzi]RNC49378.1 putative kinesin [Trypanosoma cruzi]|eukprot:XP_811599.1 kinesin [Trypanosoma cruzi strain CL Brener]